MPLVSVAATVGSSAGPLPDYLTTVKLLLVILYA